MTEPLINDASLDLDTRQYGHGAPFRDWEGDHTSLVHILWAARGRGLTLADGADEIATMILRSRWLKAQQHYARTAGEQA